MLMLVSLIFTTHIEYDSKGSVISETGINEKRYRITYDIKYSSLFSTFSYSDSYTTKNVSQLWLETNGYIKDGEFCITKSMAKCDLGGYGLYNSDVIKVVASLFAYY